MNKLSKLKRLFHSNDNQVFRQSAEAIYVSGSTTYHFLENHSTKTI